MSINEDEYRALRTVLIVISLALMVPLMIWNAWVGTILWRWFVAGRFGLPAMSLTQLMGFVLVVKFVTYRPAPPEPGNSTDRMLRAIGFDVFAPVFALLMGAIIRACGA